MPRFVPRFLDGERLAITEIPGSPENFSKIVPGVEPGNAEAILQTDHDGAQSLWMDEDSPTFEAAAERTPHHCQKQVIKGTQPCHCWVYCIDDRDVIRCVMKTFTVRLPETLVADIEAESRGRKVSKSDVIRERLKGTRQSRDRRAASWEAIADVVGSVTGLPADLSHRKKAYLEKTGYGQKHHR